MQSFGDDVHVRNGNPTYLVPEKCPMSDQLRGFIELNGVNSYSEDRIPGYFPGHFPFPS
jgi:hypothetical protein